MAPDAGDYHIRLGSAARDTGVDAGISTDIDSQMRPVGVGYDIGADEWWGLFLPLVLRHYPPIPGVPSLASIDNPDCDSTYTISWTATSLATFYILEEARGISFDNAIEIYSGPSASYVVSGQGPGRYYYRVKACNQWECSHWSNVKWVDVCWEKEPNNECSDQANGPLVSGIDYYGYPNDQWDYFKLDVQEAGMITVELTGHTGKSVQLQLREQNCGLLGYDPVAPYHLEHDGPAGRYYVYINTGSGYNSDTAYTLRATFSSQAALTRSVKPSR